MHRQLIVVSLVAVLLLTAFDTHVEAESNPCFGLTQGAPRNNPYPLVSGSVTEDGNTAIQGATMELFRCVSGSGVSQGTDTTDSSGYYEFTVTANYHYYVEAEMTGPLDGMSPSAGTKNPSDAEWVGPDADIDFAFED